MEDQNATQESLPVDVNAAPSTAETVNPVAPVETPTPKVEQEEPLHKNVRFQEVISQKNQAIQQAEYWRQQAEQALAIARTSQPQAVAPDPYANASPEEQAAWKRIAEVARKEAEAVAAEKEKQLSSRLQEQQVLTQALVYRDFQNRHPDVKAGSPEENRIADLYRRGIDLDTAYETVFAPINAQKMIEVERQKHNQKTQQKVQANLETTSVAPTNGIPTKEKISFRELVAREGKKMGLNGF